MERGNDLLLLVYHGGNIRQLHDDSKTASLYYIVTYELFCQVPVSGTNVKGPFEALEYLLLVPTSGYKDSLCKLNCYLCRF